MKIIIIGGGAAGFFAALSAKEHNPQAQVLLLEKSAQLLSKVRVSGGGRCNVTHSCFDPRQLSLNYPRGGKELLGPFHQFQPKDTIQWFTSRGVELKTEADGRMFPFTNTSETIINCLMQEARRLGVEIKTIQRIQSISFTDNQFLLLSKEGNTLTCDRLILATGGSADGHSFASSLGHTVQPPVPSLFTFNIPQFSLVDLSGISVPKTRLSIDNAPYKQEGPLLITHWGFSGPAALRLSAWGARYLNEKKYEVTLKVDWLPDISPKEIQEQIASLEKNERVMNAYKALSVPKNLWKRFLDRLNIDQECRLASIGKSQVELICRTLKSDPYNVSGKTTHKEEFVTCGGVTLTEVNFKTMESKIQKGLFFTGEVLDIDGITGGFNFQNAWTTGWLAGKASASRE